MTIITFIKAIFGVSQKITRKTIEQHQHELLITQCREQFRYLLKKNIQIPVVFL